MRFADCGVAEAWWTYWAELGDADFIALVTEGRACFDAKIASGEISEFDMPYELQDVTCYAGINPYALEGDAYDEASTAYGDCAFG